MGAQVKEISHFGMAAISGMVGMFSKEATDKLHEMFQRLFKPVQQVPRADHLTGGGDPKGPNPDAAR